LTRKLTIYRWLIYGSLLPAYFIVMLHRYSLGVVQNDLNEVFNMSAVAFASLGSMYFYAYMIMQIPTGILVDTRGVRVTVSVGMLLAGAGSILFANTASIYLIFLARLLIGTGVSVVFISILKILSNWFSVKDFGVMTGVTSALGCLGGILSQSPFAVLITMFSWRRVFLFIGLITLLAAFLCFIIVRNKPEDVGLMPVDRGLETEEEKQKIDVKKALKEIICNRYSWPPFIFFACFSGVYQSFAGLWGPAYIMNVYGMDKITATNYMLLVFIGFAIGGIVVGKLSNTRFKRKKSMILFGGLYLASWVFLVIINKGKPPVETLGCLLFAIGFSCSVVVLSWACGKDVNNPGYEGISMSFVNFGGFLGSAVVPIFLGLVMDRYKYILNAQQLYNKVFTYCLISVVFGFIITFFIKEHGQSSTVPGKARTCGGNLQ